MKGVEHRRRKREVEHADKVELAPGVNLSTKGMPVTCPLVALFAIHLPSCFWFEIPQAKGQIILYRIWIAFK